MFLLTFTETVMFLLRNTIFNENTDVFTVGISIFTENTPMFIEIPQAPSFFIYF